MAHIGIDARKYFDFGHGTYIQNLVTAFNQRPSSHSFSLFVSPDDFDRISLPKGWGKKLASYGKYSIGEIVQLGYDARKTGIDIFHEPHYTLPIGLKGRSVVTIHDLIHLKFPEYFNLPQRLYAKTIIGHAVRNAGMVITISETTKNDILATFNTDEKKIQVVYNGVGKGFCKIEDKHKLNYFREKYGLKNPYILYVGNIKPHKNIPTLLRAFKSLRSAGQEIELAFVGESLFAQPSMKQIATELGIASAIRDLGKLSPEDLVCSYNTAEVFVLPSFYEGFGATVLEAMTCGTPTIVSSGGSLPEIAGDASIVFELNKEGSLEEALRSVLSDSKLKSELAAKGARNVQRFTLDNFASNTLAVYEAIL
ncbi:MAG: glycosyltransferase family 4 protein [Ignavibacteriales bacterium]|nr:glycosyltransferase family 4 protein [Ignavibacteriales bacterium]